MLNTGFTHLLKQLWQDESGYILSAEAVLVGTVAVLGATVGLSAVGKSINREFADTALAFRSLDQSYSIGETRGCNSWTASSCFKQQPVEEARAELREEYKRMEHQADERNERFRRDLDREYTEKMEQLRKEESHQKEELKKDLQLKKDQLKKEEMKKDEPKKEFPREEEMKKDQPKKEEMKKEHRDQPDMKKPERDQPDQKKPEMKKPDPNKSQPKKPDPKKKPKPDREEDCQLEQSSELI